jgi:hypothetical protein
VGCSVWLGLFLLSSQPYRKLSVAGGARVGDQLASLAGVSSCLHSKTSPAWLVHALCGCWRRPE